MIVLIGGEKGGSGKSCLAQNTAVFLRQIFAEVLVVDCDPQKTTSEWIQDRKEQPELSQLNCIQLYGNIRNELLSLHNKYDAIVVDCGGQDSKALRSAMAVASHTLLPLRPKRRDLKTLAHLEDLISTCKVVNPNMLASVVFTQCPSLPNQAKRILEAKDVCETFMLPALNSITYSRNVYDDSEEGGYSVLEIEPNGKASSELRAIFKEFLQLSSQSASGTVLQFAQHS